VLGVSAFRFGKNRRQKKLKKFQVGSVQLAEKKKKRRRGAASPYRQKRQDFKKQDSREEAGSPSFSPMFPP
jgi:hypothetical protein